MTLTDWQKAEIKVATDKYLGKRNQEIAAHKDNLELITELMAKVYTFLSIDKAGRVKALMILM